MMWCLSIQIFIVTRQLSHIEAAPNDVVWSDIYLYTQQSAYKNIFENKKDLVQNIFVAHLISLSECRPPFAAN